MEKPSGQSGQKSRNEHMSYFFGMLGIPDQSYKADGIGAYFADIGLIGSKLKEAEVLVYQIIELPGGEKMRPSRETLDRVELMIIDIYGQLMPLESLSSIPAQDDPIFETRGSKAASSTLARSAMNNITYRLSCLEEALKAFSLPIDPNLNKESQPGNPGGQAI